uniref:Uncharacterized protein n=1 Tax=Arundo donax TaxID=35708 RepID=A0A0A8YP93_ARUDO
MKSSFSSQHLKCNTNLSATHNAEIIISGS